MNFFEHQAEARAKTKWLVFYFILAVAGIVISLYIVARYAILFESTRNNSALWLELQNTSFWSPELFRVVLFVSLGLIALGSIIKLIQLSRGGISVAEMMGGRPVDPSTDDLLERRLMNIVEEMSIASGVPAPKVYIMDYETAINAFAAGTNPSNSVIGVTRGSLEKLNRDELQGVIAHEFSHILNGDVQLNINLLSVIAGILFISTIGRLLMQSPRGPARRRGAGNALPLAGLALFIIGYLGLFFGRLIQSAVSRQREFLADASAVQFTRNPLGIAGALDKIATHSHIHMANGHSEEISHMLFATPFRSFGGLFATHPPLVDRIHRIVPQVKVGELSGQQTTNVSQKIQTPQQNEEKMRVMPQSMTQRFGTLSLEGLAMASQLLETTPSNLIEAAHSQQGAMALTLCLTVHEDDQLKNRSFQLIKSGLGEGLLQNVKSLYEQIQSLNKSKRIALLEIAFPRLKELPPETFHNFHQALTAIIKLDGKLSIFEASVLRMVSKVIERKKHNNHSLNSLKVECFEVLKMISWIGSDTSAGAKRSLQAALKGLPQIEMTEALEPPEWSTFDNALRQLANLNPGDKQKFLSAAAMAIGEDGFASESELEVFRLVSITLDVPTPINPISN